MYFCRNKEIRILLWCMDLNETLYHIAHPLRCLVLLSVFFFSFSFAEVGQFLVVKKARSSLLSNKRELFSSTVEPLSNGHRRRNRGYYMAAQGYEFYLRVLKVCLTSEQVSEAKEWEILSAREVKIRMPKGPCNILFIL